MNDEYVYVSVKLYLTDGQTEESVQNIISECDYSFDHELITDTEIVEILDVRVSGVSSQVTDIDDGSTFVDVWEVPEP